MLLKATHRNYEVDWSGKSIILQPGQFIASYPSLAHDTGVNEEKVRRIIKRFEIDRQIDRQTSNLSTIFTIINWSTYQNSDTLNNSQSTDDRQATDTPATPNKNEKNVKNESLVSPEATAIADRFIEKWQKVYPNIAYKPKEQALAAQQLLDNYETDDIKFLINKIYAHDDRNFSWRDQIRSLAKLLRKPKSDSPFHEHKNWFEALFDQFTNKE